MSDEEEETEVKVYKYDGDRLPAEDIEITFGEKSKKIPALGARHTAPGKTGTAEYPSGDVYVGGYKNGQRHGQGTYTYKEKGWKYEGAWKSDKKDGLGVMYYSNGEKYHGMWKNNKRSGQGTHIYANKDIYTGEWLDGAKHGIGSYIYRETGSELYGTWKQGKFESGRWTDKYETAFKGKFENQLPTSDGSFSFANGNSQQGQYKQMRMPDGNLKVTWVGGEIS